MRNTQQTETERAGASWAVNTPYMCLRSACLMHRLSVRFVTGPVDAESYTSSQGYMFLCVCTQMCVFFQDKLLFRLGGVGGDGDIRTS